MLLMLCCQLFTWTSVLHLMFLSRTYRPRALFTPLFVVKIFLQRFLGQIPRGEQQLLFLTQQVLVGDGDFIISGTDCIVLKFEGRFVTIL